MVIGTASMWYAKGLITESSSKAKEVTILDTQLTFQQQYLI